jgi:type IV pilus assembly protein PilC
MLFKYRAFTADGRRITGHMWAQEESKVAVQLHLLHIQPISIYRVMWVKRQLKPGELVDFLWYVIWMLRAGVPLQEAMEELTRSAHTGKQCQLARQMMAYMENGLLLSEAMALLPAVFSPLAVYYTAVGEKSGQLLPQLTLLLSTLKWQNKWQDNIARVLAYPLFTLCVAIGALFYLLLEVVPTLVTLLPVTEVPQTLPAIVAMTIWVKAYGMHAIALSLVLLIMSVGCIAYFPACRYGWDAGILRIPLVGRLLRDLALTRMAEVVAHLHGAGFTLLNCLYVAQDLMQNQALQRQLVYVAQTLEEGETLTHSFSQRNIFPPPLLRALHLAEKSGQVAVALEHAAQFFRAQIVARMQLVEIMLGPLCLLLVGGLLIGLVLLVFAPLFNAMSQF